MLFYGKYENGKRYICAYDEEKHGAPRDVFIPWYDVKDEFWPSKPATPRTQNTSKHSRTR